MILQIFNLILELIHSFLHPDPKVSPEPAPIHKEQKHVNKEVPKEQDYHPVVPLVIQEKVNRVNRIAKAHGMPGYTAIPVPGTTCCFNVVRTDSLVQEPMDYAF